MQYTLLEDAWAPKARFGGKPDCRRAAEASLLKNDTAARRPWTTCDEAPNTPSLNLSSVKEYLTRAYFDEGPAQLIKLLPSQFVESIQKYARCSPAGKMYTREGLFQRYPEEEPMRPRGMRARYGDDGMVNVVLYAVTLGMIALVVIDTILRFRR